ncbi:MAG: hypothetical protein OEM62_08340 [Acidobacteriota bacterium]|nr:hypothetical protein [Acidobacteriota bacterium]
MRFAREFKWEVLAIESSGNQTISEAEFETDEKVGKSMCSRGSGLRLPGEPASGFSTTSSSRQCRSVTFRRREDFVNFAG